MKAVFTISLIIAIISAKAQGFKSTQVVNNLIVIGKVDSVYSKILKEERKIWVYIPSGDNDAYYGKKKYPVLYLLDGDENFQSVASMTWHLSQGNGVCPDMIIVGILNTDRWRDQTPSHSVPPGMFGSETSGGGENFTAFIQRELMPYVDSAYSTANYKMIVGHSTGGLTVVNMLINHPDMFNSYVAIDPSMWWDNRKLLSQAETVLKQKRYDRKSFYLAIANTMPYGMDTTQVRADTNERNTGHIRAILLLKDAAKSNAVANKLNFAYKYYGDENHGTVPFIAEWDALHFLFKDFQLPPGFLKKAMDPLSKNEPSAQIQAQFDTISKHLGYKVSPPEQAINFTADNFVRMKQFDKALPFLLLNLRNYPDSFSANKAMGNYYVAKGDNINATAYYSKALKIIDDPDTKTKLNKLREKKM